MPEHSTAPPTNSVSPASPPETLPSGVKRTYRAPVMTDPLKLLLREPFSRFSRRYLKMVASGDLTAGDLLVLLFVADKTVSWRRLWEELSYTDFEEGTGMTRKGVAGVVRRLMALDLLVRKRGRTELRLRPRSKRDDGLSGARSVRP